MHELSVANNIIEIVEEYAIKLHAKVVSEIELDIGSVSGVIPESLKFVMDIAMQDSLLKNSKIIINVIPAKARCKKCNNNFDIDDIYSLCTHCGSIEFEVIQGKELKVKSIKID